MKNYVSVDAPITKMLAAWLAAVGIASWSDFAAMLAAIYSAILICEWLWLRFGRPFCEARGWVKPLAHAARRGDVK